MNIFLNAALDKQLYMLLYGGLIVWGITSLLVYELGPLDIFQRFREIIGVRRDIIKDTCTGKNVFAKGFCCFKCASFWVSLIITFCMVKTEPLAFICVVIALRTVAIVIDRIVNG